MLRRTEASAVEPIADFIGEIERQLETRLDAAYLQTILSETEAHLRQAAEEMIAVGVSAQEAERAAVEAFGKPRFQAPPSRLASMLALASGGAAFTLALTSLDDFKPGSPAGFPLVAAVVGLPLLFFGALGYRGAAPRFRALIPTLVAGASILWVGLPSQFVISPRSGNERAFLPLLDDPFFVRAIRHGAPHDAETALRAPYAARLGRMASWAVAIPGAWTILSLGAQSAGYGLCLARRARRRRPSGA